MGELWPWLRIIFDRRGRLITGGLLILLTVLSGIGLLGLSGWFLTASAITGTLLAQGAQATLNIYVPGSGIRFFAITRTVARYVERVFNHDTVLRLLADLRVRLFNTLSRQLPSEHQFSRASDLLTRLVKDIDALDNLYLRLLAPLGVTLLAIATVSGLALLVNGTLALWLVAIFTLLTVCITLGLARANRNRSAQRTDDLESLRGRLIETLEGQAELQATGLIGRHWANLDAEDSKIMDHQVDQEALVSWTQGLVTGTVQGAALLSLVLGLVAFEAGNVSGPVVVLIALACLGLGELFIALPPAYADLGGTIASARRLNRSIRHRRMKSAPVIDVPHPGELEWRNIDFGYNFGCDFGYNSGDLLLRQFSLHLAAGDHIGFVGPSGSGKSTLADLAAGLLAPLQGEMVCNGRVWIPADGVGSARRIAYLPQQIHLFNGTLLDNLLIGRTDATSGEIWHALEVVQLAAVVDQWPLSLTTWVGEAGRQLSGGEARRVALARTLLMDAPIIILDEPFTGLDRETASWISETLTRELRGRTVIGLAHGEAALPPMHRIYNVDTMLAQPSDIRSS